METLNHHVDIFHDNLVFENVTELSQADLDLITALWLQDLEDVASHRKNKLREDMVPDDNTLAFNLFARDLENMQNCLRDQQLAESIDAALDADRELLNEVMREEDLARRDRELAMQIDRRENPTRPSSVMSNRSTLAPSVQGSIRRPPSVVSGSATLYSRTASPAFVPRQTVKCAVCNEDTTRFVRVPCNDAYCIPCISELFEHATKDESLMPPRCCRREIPFNSVVGYLPVLLRNRFTRKLEEHNTLNRLYCSNPSCAAFIGSADGDRRTVQCPECRTRVCTSCKNGAHPSFMPCKEDKATVDTMEFCREQGWQRCPGCQRMIELAHGCYHMTCLCRTEFCYLCRAIWKQCTCVQWDEQRLVLAAQERVRDEIRRPDAVPNPPIQPAAAGNLFGFVDEPEVAPNPGTANNLFRFMDRPEVVPNPIQPRFVFGQVNINERVRDMVEHLRENHECNHPSWETEWGPSQCQTCYHRLDRFILRCRKCRIRACVRCRRNRL